MDIRRWRLVDLLVFELLKGISSGRIPLNHMAHQKEIDKSLLFVPEIEREIPILQPLDLSTGKPIEIPNKPVSPAFKLISFKEDKNDKK